MVSRRALLVGGTGVVAVAAVGGAAATHRLDDALRTVGVEPRPEADPGDLRLVAAARADAAALVVLAGQSGAPAGVVSALEQQRDALPAPARPSSATVTGDLVEACRASADARAQDVTRAVSLDLVQVLASMAAGLDQCARAVETR